MPSNAPKPGASESNSSQSQQAEEGEKSQKRRFNRIGCLFLVALAEVFLLSLNKLMRDWFRHTPFPSLTVPSTIFPQGRTESQKKIYDSEEMSRLPIADARLSSVNGSKRLVACARDPAMSKTAFLLIQQSKSENRTSQETFPPLLSSIALVSRNINGLHEGPIAWLPGKVAGY